MKAETRLQINRPLEEVFTFLTDTGYQHLYDRSLVSVSRDPDGPMRQGTEITEIRKVMGRAMTSQYQVAEYEPCSRYVGRSLAGSDTGTRLFQANNEGTHVTYCLEFEQHGFAALTAPPFGRFLKRELDQDMALAKRLLESNTHAPKSSQEKNS